MDDLQPAAIESISPEDWAITPESIKDLVQSLIPMDIPLRQGNLLTHVVSAGAEVTALQAQVQGEQALNRIFQAIRNSLDLATIFTTATTETAQLLTPLDCCVVQYQAEEQLWHTVAAFHHSPAGPSALGLTIPDVNNPCSAQLRHLDIVRINDTRQLSDQVNQSVAQVTPGAWLLIPLVIEGQLWGSFSLLSPQPLVWSDRQVQLAQAVAAQLEVGIHQASLYQQLEQELIERRQIESALRESKAQFQSMAANVPGAIFRYILHPDGRDGVLYMSPGCYGLWEVDADTVIADASILWSVVDPEDLPAMQASVLESARTLTPWRFAWRITTPSGRKKWLEAAGSPTRQANGTIIWDTLILDVTDRKQAERRFQALAANMPGVIYQYVLRADGTDAMLYVSAGCQNLWELTPQQIMDDVGTTWRMVRLEDLMAMRTSVLVSAQTLEVWNCEWSIVTPSGRQKWLRATARPEGQSNGDVVWNGLILDVSDRKAAETALVESEHRFQTLADNVPGIIFGYRLATDGTDQFIYLSSGFRDVYGFDPDSALQDTNVVWQLTHPEDLAALRQSVTLSYQTLSTWRCQYRVILPSGQVKWLQGVSRPRRQPNGDVIWDGLTIDITDQQTALEERAKAEAALAKSEQRLSTLISNLPGFVYRSQNIPDYTPEFLSQGVMAITGYSSEEFCRGDVAFGQLIHRDDADTVWQITQGAVQQYQTYECEYRIITKTGEEKWVWERGQGIYDQDGRLQWLEGFVTDISDRKQAEAALRDSESRYRLLAENAKDLICLHQLNGQFLYVSPSCETLLGYQYSELWGQDLGQFVHPDDRYRVMDELHIAASGSKSVPITYRLRQKSGQYRWFETLTKPIRNDAEQIIQLQTTSRDVTDRIQVQQQLQHEALHDSLTGLPNRHLLMDRLDLTLQRAKRLACYDFAVIFLDLDRFKVINDSLGHLAGDQLLVVIAQRLAAAIGPLDLAARLGGDEFVVLLANIQGIRDVVQVTQRLFAALQIPLHLENREVYTTASAGIVLGSAHYEEATHLLRDADIAMYQAKTKGKACYDVFNAAMHTQALHRLHLENDLRRALENQEFVLHYQPIVVLETGQLAGFEALIRWQHPTEGLKPPGEFIAIAEEIGLISAIDQWGLATACQQMVIWLDRFPQWADLKVNVNLSAADLQRSVLIQELDQVLAQTGLEGEHLTLEITESMLIEDIETTIQLLNQLKERRVQISIDDFGTGYSSLSYLHRLPVDSLKVDRSFVNQMPRNCKNHQIIETIMALSRQLNLDTVAEGVETQAQLDGLRSLGYRLGQGFFFSHGLTAAAATELLANPLPWECL
jgi:diguanylate cyclase (GGDEF)-like protein/PAS domain S-box-containing protein